MTLNDPIVLWGIGAVGAVGAWLARQLAMRLDRRISSLETSVEVLQVQAAGRAADKELLDRMYTELQQLTQLTHRIAGHLNIS